MGFNPTETNIYKIQTNSTFLWPQRNTKKLSRWFCYLFVISRLLKFQNSDSVLKHWNFLTQTSKTTNTLSNMLDLFFYKLSLISPDHHGQQAAFQFGLSVLFTSVWMLFLVVNLLRSSWWQLLFKGHCEKPRSWWRLPFPMSLRKIKIFSHCNKHKNPF